MRGPAIALTLSVLLVPAPAQAVLFTVTTVLSGLNERPTPVITPGSGTATLDLDTDANTLRIRSVFQNLLSPVNAAHIHCCSNEPINSPVATAVPAFPGFPLNQTSGNYDQTFNLADAGFYRPGFITANGNSVTSARNVLVNGILANQTYFNIHTVQFPGGEIRGQLVAMPEPTTWAMLILGFGLAGTALRRRSASLLRA